MYYTLTPSPLTPKLNYLLKQMMQTPIPKLNYFEEATC
jgi:hypothetical protein